MCHVRFEILTVVATKIISWNIILRIPLKFSWGFEEICLLTLLAIRVMLVSFVTYSFDPEDGDDSFPQKRRLAFKRTTGGYIPEKLLLISTDFMLHYIFLCNINRSVLTGHRGLAVCGMNCSLQVNYTGAVDSNPSRGRDVFIPCSVLSCVPCEGLIPLPTDCL
jgi:hypothetical protein